VDGNKRVAVAAAELFLLANGHELGASDEELEEITLGFAGARLSKKQLTDLFGKHVIVRQ